MSIEMFEVCQGLIAKDLDLARRIRDLLPESAVQAHRAMLTEAEYGWSNPLVLWEGQWEDEIPF